MTSVLLRNADTVSLLCEPYCSVSVCICKFNHIFYDYNVSERVFIEPKSIFLLFIVALCGHRVKFLLFLSLVKSFNLFVCYTCRDKSHGFV